VLSLLKAVATRLPEWPHENWSSGICVLMPCSTACLPGAGTRAEPARNGDPLGGATATTGSLCSVSIAGDMIVGSLSIRRIGEAIDNNTSNETTFRSIGQAGHR
jgi:hypothetical protein